MWMMKFYSIVSEIGAFSHNLGQERPLLATGEISQHRPFSSFRKIHLAQKRLAARVGTPGS
jgi:hypothetical protein